MKSFYLSSAGRCGSHWLSGVLSFLFDLKKIPFKMLNIDNEFSHKQKLKEIDDPGKNIYVSHLPFNYCKDIDMNIIVMVRDPRDICVSATYYWIMKGSYKLEEFNQYFYRALESGGSNPSFQNSYIKYKKQIPHFLYKYEDMVNNDQLLIENILNYFKLGHDSERLKQALELHSFKSLTKGRSNGEEQIFDHYRKGIIGDWKNYFTEEMNKKFCEKHIDLMKSWGYDD